MDKRMSQMFWTSADSSGSNSSLKGHEQTAINKPISWRCFTSRNISALSQRDIKTISYIQYGTKRMFTYIHIYSLIKTDIVRPVEESVTF